MRLCAALLATGMAVAAQAGSARAASLGQMGCTELLASPEAQLASSTPPTHWLGGYLVGRRYAAQPAGHVETTGFGTTGTESLQAWRTVTAYCVAHAKATLRDAAQALADAQAGHDAPSPQRQGTGSVDEDGCDHIKAVDAIAPGHYEEVFGPWLDGFLSGRDGQARPDGDPDLRAAWQQVNQACRASPGSTVLQAAATVTGPRSK